MLNPRNAAAAAFNKYVESDNVPPTLKTVLRAGLFEDVFIAGFAYGLKDALDIAKSFAVDIKEKADA